MNEQLEQANDLIQNDQTEDAIAIIEAVIRADRTNEQAWWLLANATNNPDAKRNALNQVLQLTDNQSRIEQAQAILSGNEDQARRLNTPDEKQVGMGDYQAIDEAPSKPASRFNCATLSLLLVGIVGICGIVSVFGIFSVAGDIFSFVTAPETYTDGGTLDMGSAYDGTLSAENPAVGYTYTGTTGETVQLTVTSEADTAPFIVIYDLDTGQILTEGTGVAGSIYQPQTFNNLLMAQFDVPRDDTYLITLRGTALFGTELGYGDYTLDVVEVE